MTSDNELVAQTLRGQRSAYEELVRRHQGGLYRYLLRVVRNSETAHDVAQEAFVKGFVALKSFRPEGNFRTWLYQIGRNTALDHLRRGHVRYEVSFPTSGGSDEDEGLPREIGTSKDPDPEAMSLAGERAAIVRAALERLPEDYREVLQLRHFEELSYEEIAEVTGSPLGTVKSKIFRARDMLRGALAGEPAVATGGRA